MGLVDSQNLKWEVKADYPYSLYIVDTEEQAREIVQWEKEVHKVGCTVRVIGPKVRFYGMPNVKGKLHHRYDDYWDKP